MKEQRLSAIATLSIECDWSKNINIDEVVDTFAKLKSLCDQLGRIVKSQHVANATYVGVDQSTNSLKLMTRLAIGSTRSALQ